MNLTLKDIEDVQRQIDELKRQIDELKTQIDEPKTQIEDKIKDLKQDKWKLPEYEDGSKWIASTFSIAIEGDSLGYTKAGRRRATEALAERCAKMSKERDLLEAYRDYLEPEYVEPDWGDSNMRKYFIYIHKGKYAIGYNYCIRDLGKVYGSKETMEKICEALNNGSISL